ncbi:putative transcriptional regulatory protein [Aphelenchoides bicaudatus]|nr:putative transcriptional regulatory protein [Aphelenchoides bicaudatus]
MLSNLLRASFMPQQYRCLSVAPSLFKGHSKWQNIKATKGKNDAIKAKKISFLLTKLKAVVKSTGGFDLKLNRNLANLKQEFITQNLPLDTFNNYLVKLKNKPEMTLYFELRGPSGSFFLVEAETDSANRTRSTIQRHINKIGNFRIVTEDLLKRFDEKLIATVNGRREGSTPLSLADVEETAIELDCEEVEEVTEENPEEPGPRFELTFQLQNMEKLEDSIKGSGLNLEGIESRMIPHTRIAITEDDAALVGKFYDAMLNEIVEVKNVFDNLD